MSIRLMTQVWELDLPHPQLLVALALADWGNDDGTSIYPGLASVGWKCGYSDRQVRRIVRELEAAGLLVKVADATADRGIEYRMITAAGRPKPPRKGADKMSGGQNDRPDTQGPGGGHSDPGGADMAVSAEPSVEPSDNPPAPDGAGADDPIAGEVERLCQLLSSELRIAHNTPPGSKEHRVAPGWLGACRGLLERDGFTPQQVEYTIRWVVRHTYWSRRVKSMTRLRQEMQPIVADIRTARAGGTHIQSARAQAVEERTEARMARLREISRPQLGGGQA